MYQIQMQFIPGNDAIWVARLDEDSHIHYFDNESEANAKAEELQSADPHGRIYKVIYL